MGGRVLLWLFLIGILVIGAGFYIQSRQLESSKISKLTTLTQIQGISASECRYDVGGYGTGSAGYMYIYNNELRVNIPSLTVPNFSGNMDAVLSLDGTRIMDPNSIKAAGNNVTAANILNQIITQAPWQCSPWWFPSPSLFKIQNGVSF